MMQCGGKKCRWPLVLLQPECYSGPLTGLVSPTRCTRLAFVRHMEEEMSFLCTYPELKSSTKGFIIYNNWLNLANAVGRDIQLKENSLHPEGSG